MNKPMLPTQSESRSTAPTRDQLGGELSLQAVPSRQRKVLMLAYQFPPDSGSIQRVTRFVQYLSEFGWDPIVITRRMNEALAVNSELMDQVRGKAKIMRVGPFPAWRSLVIRLANSRPAPGPQSASADAPEAERRSPGLRPRLRTILKWVYRTAQHWLVWPDQAIWWLPSATAAALYQIATNRIDAIYVVSPPHSVHLAGAFLRRLTGVRFVADFRDPWSTDPDMVMPSRLHRLAHKQAENFCLRSADAVISTTDRQSEHFKTVLGPGQRHRVNTVPNGYDGAEMQDLPQYDGRTFEILYAGAFNGTRRITPLLAALDLLRRNEPEIYSQVRVRIIGKINPLVTTEVKSYELDECVRFQDHLPHRQVLSESSQSAVLLLVVHSDEYVAQVCIPAKLFEYLATPRPILAITPPGAAADLIEQFQAGVVCRPDAPEGIARAIAGFYRQYQAGQLVRRGSQEGISRFERRNLTKSLSEILTSPSSQRAH